jgi:hypothetical protein
MAKEENDRVEDVDQSKTILGNFRNGSKQTSRASFQGLS